jgi:polyisoprenoid-binding protein YceI
MFKTLAIAGLSLSSLFVSTLAHADWQVVNDKSQVSFVSIKKDSIAEAHHFKRLEGSLSEQGALSISIDLGSAETMIPIRNERLSQFLFETDKYPRATLTADLQKLLMTMQQPGQYVVEKLQGELDFHGVKKALSFDVLVTKTAQGHLVVSSFTPVIINSSDFAVTAGVKKLQQLAGLPSVASAVPVTFALTLAKQ